jgi:hypothetical protein
MTVEEFKEIAAGKTGIAAGLQRLIAQGKLLEDGYTLQHYGVARGSTIHILLRL